MVPWSQRVAWSHPLWLQGPPQKTSPCQLAHSSLHFASHEGRLRWSSQLTDWRRCQDEVHPADAVWGCQWSRLLWIFRVGLFTELMIQSCSHFHNLKTNSTRGLGFWGFGFWGCVWLIGLVKPPSPAVQHDPKTQTPKTPLFFKIERQRIWRDW